MRTSRRAFFGLTLPALAIGQAAVRPLKIVCVGGHPDDPESGCGGTLARYAELGHQVTIIYLTRGEAGIPGESHEQAAAIRTAESQAACKILGARPLFAGQIDGATVASKDAAQSFAKLIQAENPQIVFTQWPIDGHMDHQVASLLTYRAWLSARPRFELYYYEVDLGAQTMNFHPTDYIDISSVRAKKRAALFAHKSQHGEEIYREHHEIMENYRGRESGFAAAEAFVHLARANGEALSLPGLSTVR